MKSIQMQIITTKQSLTFLSGKIFIVQFLFLHFFLKDGGGGGDLHYQLALFGHLAE